MSDQRHHRGNVITLLGDCWRYASDDVPVSDDPHRACGHCGRADTPEGHDACLGTLPRVRNACCGHGRADEAYIQFEDGSELRGDVALEWAALQKAVAR